MEGYLTVLDTVFGEYEEKRSRFIAAVCPVDSEEKALKFIKKTKTKYYDARHNVYAYRIHNGECRFSDDGEPHGTAGKPIMDIICGRELYNVCVVVTRYFGGILLGTGGLVKAYSDATKNALSNSKIVEMGLLGLYRIECDYSEFDRLNDFLKRNAATVTNTQFFEKVIVDFSMDAAYQEDFSKKLIEAFNAKLAMENAGKIFAPVKIL